MNCHVCCADEKILTTVYQMQANCVFLLCIDNTASANRNVKTDFSYISFAKSFIRIFNEDYFSKRVKFSKILIAFSDISGKPLVLYVPQPSQNYLTKLEVSPLGKFDETVEEGLIELNKFRSKERDNYDQFFYPKKPEVYSIALLSDFSSLNRKFFESKFSVGEFDEYMFRPDEGIVFFDIVSPPDEGFYPKIKAAYQEAFDQLFIDVYPLSDPYDALNGSRFLLESIQYPTFSFQLVFDQIPVKFKLNLIPNMNWPFPFDLLYKRSSPPKFIYPAYQCIKCNETVDIRDLPYDEYRMVLPQGLGQIEKGQYFANASTGLPFAIVTVDADLQLNMKILPYNFPTFLSAMRPVPSKVDCDQYLKSVPPPYIDGVVKYFTANSYSYSPENAARKQRLGFTPRDEAYATHFNMKPKNEPMNLIIYPEKFTPEQVSDLLSEIVMTRNPYPSITLRAPQKRTRINRDTMDDIEFQSLIQVRAKTSQNYAFARSPSPITEDILRGLMPKPQDQMPVEDSLVAEVERKEEETKEVVPEDDSLSMLEELLLMLREHSFIEIEHRLIQLQNNNPLLFQFTKQFLAKSLQRFDISTELFNKNLQLTSILSNILNDLS